VGQKTPSPSQVPLLSNGKEIVSSWFVLLGVCLAIPVVLTIKWLVDPQFRKIVDGPPSIGRCELCGEQSDQRRCPDCVARKQTSTVSKGSAHQIARYGVSALTSAAVTVGLPVLLHEVLGIEQAKAAAISQTTALLVNFVMIRIFVFRSRRGARRDFVHFAASAVAFRGLEYVFFLVLFEVGGLYYLLALILTLGTSSVLKFVWYRFLFDGRPEPAI